jgi:hypothetical protein
MELKQHATEHCITAMLLDISRLFNCRAMILNVGDKRYWESRLKWNEKQFTEKSNDIRVDYAGTLQVDQSQNTAPTNINYVYIAGDNAIKPITLKCKRKSITIPMLCKINVDNFIDVMSKTEELIDKSSSVRVFNYVLFGKQLQASYKVQYDANTESKANYDANQADEGNGWEVEFTIELKFNYYSPTHKSQATTKISTVNQTVTVQVPTGGTLPNGQPEMVNVDQIVPVLVHDSANIMDADQDMITKLVHKIYTKL